LENNPNFSYRIDNDSLDSEMIVKNFITQIESLIEDETLNENELKLGQALYEIFQNYDDIFIGNSNNKFNKNIILLSLREMTNLSTKEIRSSMKKYKLIYYGLVQGMLK
jgi:hypothetical protein